MGLLQPGDTVLAPQVKALVADGAVILVFFKINCPVCQMTLPYFERLHPAMRIYGVSQNDDEDTRHFAKRFGVTFPMLRDREEDDFPLSNEFGITHVPATFFVEPGGRISRVIEGWNRREMEALGALRETDNVPAWKAG